MGWPVSKKVFVFFYLVFLLFFTTFSCKKSPNSLIFKDIHGGLVSLADAEARRTIFLFLNQCKVVFLEKTGESEESIMENLIERLRD